MTAISDVIKDVPKVPWHGNDNTMRKCPDCNESGINYCPMCRRSLSPWAIYRVCDKEAVKVINLSGREYPLNGDDLLAMTLILMYAGFTTDDNKNASDLQPLRWTKKKFNQVYYSSPALRRIMMDLMVDSGSILIVKEDEKKTDNQVRSQPVKRRGRPRKTTI